MMADQATASQRIAPLREAIATIVDTCTDGLSEHQLIQQLQQAPYELFDKQALADSLRLFQTHFLVFHCLYLLRDEWREQQYAELSISTLKIQKQAWQAQSAALTQADPLRRYYLDWQQFEQTDGADVEALLDSFWRQQPLSGLETSDEAQLEQALQQLALNQMPVDLKQLKRHYRQRLHQVHPDKGGSNAAVQQIQWAYQLIERQLR